MGEERKLKVKYAKPEAKDLGAVGSILGACGNGQSNWYGGCTGGNQNTNLGCFHHGNQNVDGGCKKGNNNVSGDCNIGNNETSPLPPNWRSPLVLYP